MTSRRPIRLAGYDDWKTTEPAEYEPCRCEGGKHVCSECEPEYLSWLIMAKWLVEPEDADT